MSDVIRMGASWGASVDRMSPQMQARCAAADAAYERQRVAEQRERAQRAAIAEEDRIRASIELALDRGEVVNIREAFQNGGVGRTKAEALAHFSAVQDREDAQARRRAAKEIERLGQAYYDGLSADTTAPSESDLAEHQALVKARQEQYRAAGQARHRRAEARAVAQTEIAKDRERQLIRRWSA